MRKYIYFYKLKYICVSAIIILGNCSNCIIFAQSTIDNPSTFIPVITGARALGFGGAFIALADDATSVNVNPAGLAQLRKSEFSFVLSSMHRKDKIELKGNPEASGTHNIFDDEINFLSFVYPSRIVKRDMVFAITYQHLYDFMREWPFKISFVQKDIINKVENIYYNQNGKLTALGLAYCLAITPKFSFGINFNIFNNGITYNKWKRYYRYDEDIYLGNPPIYTNDITEVWEEFIFKGYNANLGLLWKINSKMSIGCIFKTPFTAKIEHQYKMTTKELKINNKKLKMPLSYGLGFVYNFSDKFLISSDLYLTKWDRFRFIESNGNEFSPMVTAMPFDKSNVDPTLQIRLGMEYLYINKKHRYVIPFRAGFFYDPQPAYESNNDFFGITFGSGIDLNEKDWFSFDFAYQYRFGKIKGLDIPEHRSFSQKQHEHKFYVSMIIYKR